MKDKSKYLGLKKETVKGTPMINQEKWCGICHCELRFCKKTLKHQMGELGIEVEKLKTAIKQAFKNGLLWIKKFFVKAEDDSRIMEEIKSVKTTHRCEICGIQSYLPLRESKKFKKEHRHIIKSIPRIFVTRKSEGTMMNWGHGFAYRELIRDRTVTALWPLNHIIGFCRFLSFKLRHAKRGYYECPKCNHKF